MDDRVSNAKRPKHENNNQSIISSNIGSSSTTTKTTSNLLIRLSQGCLRHQQTCHSGNKSKERDQEGMEEEEEEEEEEHEETKETETDDSQCASEMQKLSRLIPLIEASCQNTVHISPTEIQNLALFYISVVQRTYCPHSLLYIFKDGKGGIEVLPRVHQLLKHVVRTGAMTQDTVQSIIKRHQSPHNTNATASISQRRYSPNAVEEIARACAVLLGCIPEPHLQSVIVSDIILLWNDTNALLSSYSTDDNPSFTYSHPWNITISIFTNTLEYSPLLNNKNQEYVLNVTSVASLLILQHCTLQILLTIMADLIYTEENHIQTKTPLKHQTCQHLLECIHQMMFNNIVPNTKSLTDSSMNPYLLLLHQRNKILSLRLLQILIPELLFNCTSQSALHHDLINIISIAVLHHIQSCHEYSTLDLDEPLRLEYNTISSILTTLLQDTYMSSSIRFNELTNIQVCHVYTLLDCLPYAPCLWNDGTSKRLIRIILHCTYKCISSLSISQNTHDDKANKRILRSISDYCVMESIWKSLFLLLDSTAYTHIISAIIIYMWEDDGNEYLQRSDFAYDQMIDDRVQNTMIECLEQLNQKALDTSNERQLYHVFICITLYEGILERFHEKGCAHIKSIESSLCSFFTLGIQLCKDESLLRNSQLEELMTFSTTFVLMMLFLKRHIRKVPLDFENKRSRLKNEIIQNAHRFLQLAMSKKIDTAESSSHISDIQWEGCLSGVPESVVRLLKFISSSRQNKNSIDPFHDINPEHEILWHDKIHLKYDDFIFIFEQTMNTSELCIFLVVRCFVILKFSLKDLLVQFRDRNILAFFIKCLPLLFISNSMSESQLTTDTNPEQFHRAVIRNIDTFFHLENEFVLLRELCESDSNVLSSAIYSMARVMQIYFVANYRLCVDPKPVAMDSIDTGLLSIFSILWGYLSDFSSTQRRCIPKRPPYSEPCFDFMQLILNLTFAKSFNVDGREKEALWTVSLTFFMTLSLEEFCTFNNKFLNVGNSKETVDPHNENLRVCAIGNKTIDFLEWILTYPFSSNLSEEKMKWFANVLGNFILTNDYKLLLAHFQLKESASLVISGKPRHLDQGVLDAIFSFVDEMLKTHCGISDVSMSCTATATQCLGTFDSIGSRDRSDISNQCNSQVFIIQLLISLCHNIPTDFSQRSVLIERGVIRIFRLWIVSAITTSSEKFIASKLLCYHDVQKFAIEQLISLRKNEVVGPDTVRNFDNGFLPGLFCEILFRALVTISKFDMNTSCFTLLSDFLRYFIGLSAHCAIENVSFQEYDCSVLETLNAFDSILPATIAGLILEQDYECLCKCTKFRILLLSKMKLLNRRIKNPRSGALNLLGGNTFKKRLTSCNTLISSEDLSRQTSKLCVLEDANQPILSEILKKLLLVQEKSPFIFFQKTVVQSKVSLSTLLRKTEFSVLEGLIFILGKYEMSNNQENFHDRSWNSVYCNQAAFLALKKASLLLNRPIDITDNSHNSQSQVALSNSVGTVNSGTHTNPENLVELWIRKHFMGLLVSITTKWKRGRLETKISAMGALRVLIRFLNEADAPQYITHVFGVVDGSMHIELLDKEDRYTEVLHLHDLAIRSLSHFVRTLLLLEKKEILGANLCNIIVSLYPLFQEHLETSCLSNFETNQMFELTRRNAVDIVECLLDDALSHDWISFFHQIPFLPKDSKFHHVRDVLKRNGLNFESLLLVGTQTQGDGSSVNRIDLDDDRSCSAEELKLQSALSCRLNALSRLIGHENENVRKVCLTHIIEIVLSHRSLFLKLVEIEDTSNRFLTVETDNQLGLVECGSINRLIKKVLKRCAVESSGELLILLAKCLGVLGAIKPMLITDVFDYKENDRDNDDLIWIRKKAPWTFQSVKQQVGLQLLKKHFVIALKAAPTPTDQHKIAFAIQEVLKHLDGEILRSDEQSGLTQSDGDRKEMSHWLKEQLESSGVLSIIEPYWTSLYKQNEASASKMPPFFSTAKSYYSWLADWARFMIERSVNNQKSIYRELFFATRSALRSDVGLGVIEFLLPYLILDAMCFGDELDKSTVLDELICTLTTSANPGMPMLELQKSISVVFSTIKVFQWWSENEIEERHKAQRVDRASSSSLCVDDTSDSHQWPTEESLAQIGELLDNISLDTCSQAAEYVGMFAQSIYFLEVDSRKKEARSLHDLAIHTKRIQNHTLGTEVQNQNYVSAIHTSGMNLGRAHRLFSELDDRNSMGGIANCRSDRNIMDQILEKKACEDWESVFRLCELASQLEDESCKSHENIIRHLQAFSLLRLGKIESALMFSSSFTANPCVGNEVEQKSVAEKLALVPCAIEASWRLGRWDLLQSMICSLTNKDVKRLNTSDFESRYNFHLGCAMLSLRKKESQSLSKSIREGRDAIIPSLSVVANENYPRALPFISKLQILQEIESAGRILSNTEHASTLSDDDLKQSLSSVQPQIDLSMETIAVRLAISSIMSDKHLQTSLWLTAGRLARKDGLYHIAESFLSHAHSIYNNIQIGTSDKNEMLLRGSNGSEIMLQMAKVKHANGEITEAIRILTSQAFEDFLLIEDTDELSKAVQQFSDENMLLEIGRIGLQSTQWMVDCGLKSGSDAIRRYKVLTRMLPDWERAHHKFAKYLDSVAAARIHALTLQNGGNPDDDESRGNVIRKDRICQKYILEAISQYGEALCKNQKHVFQGLPRLLTLWFDLNSIQSDDVIGLNQDKANEMMVTFMKKIPPVSYYSVLSQLVSRIGHRDDDVVNILCAILKRILIKFPAQAMWQLGWLRHSIHSDRKKKGEDIFRGAQKGLQKIEEMRMHDLLEGSKDLFEFLINLAKYKPKRQDQKSLQIMSWKGKVELKEFLPPVQAALALSRITMGSSNARDVFPRNVPRIRAFSSNVPMMSSKAKPKKLIAFAIPEATQKKFEKSSRYTTAAQPGDIGEMHFLVKQEAKGDLRKDARVQDLNNVINRLFAQSASSNKSNKWNHRRLKLRTFAVTCLSEDCGILEWVPNTESFRNLVGSSYNPYASSHSEKRRGKRIINFSDASLRNTFAQCQDQYIKLGNLTKAAKMFDEMMLQEYPPLFYWWFVREFQDPHAWFEARTRFALSTAAWSAVGHIIGLGDRHSENILIETSLGECVHVDFDCIFDKGLLLPRPEVIPFRLTPNMIDAFGPTGADGAFSGALRSAMTTLRDNKDILLSVLEPFLKDPVIDWKRQRTQQSSISEQTSRDVNEAKRSISVIDERLRGMYNLRNPNFKKIKRVDVPSVNEDDEMARLLSLSVEGQVHKMISEATSHENLVQIYVGWMPWL